MKNSRRSFLKIAGVSALGLGLQPVLNRFVSSEENAENPEPGFSKKENVLTGKRWGMVIDTRKFQSQEDLEPIIEACHSTHNVPDLKVKNHKIMWIWEEEYKHVFTDSENPYINERAVREPPLPDI